MEWSSSTTLTEHLLDVMVRRRQQLLHVGFGDIHGFDAVDLDLHLIVELLGGTFDPDESGTSQFGQSMLIE